MEKNAAVGLGPIWTLWAWVEKNRKAVTTTVCVTAGVALIGGVVVWQQNRKTVAAGEALTDAMVANAFVRGGAPTTPEKLLQLANDYSGTGAAARAVYQAATALFTDGKYAEAHTQFQRFVSEYAENPFVPQAMYGLAACLEAQGKTDEAFKAYKNLADRFKTAGVGLGATAAVGRILESQGKLTEALPLFEEVARNDANGMLGSEARVRAAEIQQKLPPPTVTPVSAPIVSPAPVVTATNTP